MLTEAPPHSGQIALLAASGGLFAGGLLFSLSRLWWPRDTLRLASRVCTYIGILLAVIVLAWHSAQRGMWIPLGDNFDALIWLGLLLALFVQYMQRSKPLGGLDWFLTPIVILVLAAAVVFGIARPQGYDVGSVWWWVHRVSSYGGAVAFAVAFATGVMYLIVQRRLRAKVPERGPSFGSLERLEHLTYVAVSTGFALLTIGAITGLIRLASSGYSAGGSHRQLFFDAKVLLSIGVWVIYALVLHAPLNPSFRGRRTAMLSVLGFVLMIGTIVAVQLIGGT